MLVILCLCRKKRKYQTSHKSLNKCNNHDERNVNTIENSNIENQLPLIVNYNFGSMKFLVLLVHIEAAARPVISLNSSGNKSEYCSYSFQITTLRSMRTKFNKSTLTSLKGMHEKQPLSFSILKDFYSFRFQIIHRMTPRHPLLFLKFSFSNRLNFQEGNYISSV